MDGQNKMCCRNLVIIVILIIFKILPAFGAAYTPSTVPDPKTTNLNSSISDPDQMLTTGEKEFLNQKINGLLPKIQMGIVIVKEITSEFTPKQFVTEVFNLWGIGDKKKDNGLLLLVVVDQKRWEIETGYGLEGEWPDVVVKRIGEENLVPAFKEKKWADGFAKVIKQLDSTPKPDLHTNKTPVPSSVIWSGQPSPLEMKHFFIVALFFLPTLFFYIYRFFKPSYFAWKRKTLFRYPTIGLVVYGFVVAFSYFASPSTSDWILVIELLLIYWLIHFSFLVIFFMVAFFQVSKNKEVSKRLDVALGFFARHSLFFVGSLGFWGVPLVDRLIRKARFSQHECTHCQKIMNAKTDLITGKNENNFLNRFQRLEQTYEGMDYDVWQCFSCEKLSLYPIKLEKEGVEDCPKCKQRTFKYIRTKVLLKATVNRAGQGCNEFRCGSCQHYLRINYETPMVSINPGAATTDHGFGGGTSGGGGGTGWGGGSSGGGGAGGSW